MISVVVPVKNEEQNIEPLVTEIVQASGPDAPITEIIYVDDGSDDKTHDVLSKLRATYPQLRIIKHSRSCGQSAALWTGIQAAGNDVIVTLDGDGQNNPADIRKLVSVYNAALLDKTAGRVLVAGQRENLIRILSSRIANTIRCAMLQDGTRDTGCSLKLFRRKDYLLLPYFNHMHRYIPALMAREGVAVRHIDVSHRPRERGVSKYGTIDRLIAGLSDLLGVRWLLNRARPIVTITED